MAVQEVVTQDTDVKSNHFKASEDNPKVKVRSEKSGKEVRQPYCYSMRHDRQMPCAWHAAPPCAVVYYCGGLCSSMWHARPTGGLLLDMGYARNQDNYYLWLR